MTDDHGTFYFNYSDQSWSTSSSNLSPIPRSSGSLLTFFFDCLDEAGGTKVTDNTNKFDRTTVMQYTGTSVWWDYTGTVVSGNNAYTFYNSNYNYPQLAIKVNPETNGTYNIRISCKHSGSWFDDFYITLVIKVASMTTIGLNTRTGNTLYTTATYGQSTLSPEIGAVANNGHTLDGWFTSASGGQQVINSSGYLISSVSGYTDSSGNWAYTGSSLTLYAQWTERTYSMSSNFVNCSGSLSKNGGSGSSSVSGVRFASDTVTVNWTAPQQESGYQKNFSYCKVTQGGVTVKSTTSDTGSMSFNFSDTGATMLLTSLTAEVRYTKSVQLTLQTNDASMGKVRIGSSSSFSDTATAWVDVTSGSATVSIQAGTVSGYQFDYWSDGSTSQNRTISVSAATTLTAHFSQAVYSITMVAGTGGTVSPSTYQGYAGQSFSVAATPSSGYEFEYWSASYGSVIASSTSASTTVTIGSSHDTITAHFKVATSNITLLANASGGFAGSGTIQNGATALTVSTAPTRTDTNYTIIEYYLTSSYTTRIAYKQSSTWKLDASVSRAGTTYTDSSGRWQLGSGNYTFYAKWQGTTMTATFNANGGTVSPSTKTVEYGSAYGELPTPTNSDTSLTFGGWWLDGSEVTSETIVAKTSAHTLTAQWLSGLIVTFNATGGYCDTARKTVTQGQTYGELPTPTWSGHTFGGWWTAETGGTQITSSTTVSTSTNQTLYAHWTVPTHTFTLSYNANGGSGAPSTVTWTGEGDSHQFTVSTTVPTKSNQEFIGWAKSSTATYPEYLPSSSITVEWNGSSATTTLYAVWSGIEPPVEDADIDSTRIYKADSSGKAPGTAYIDVSSRLSIRPTIKEVENYGTTASFTIVNGETSTDNLLASTCVWSSGTGAISTGQFVRIRHGSATGMSWGWFFITSIEVSDDLVTVTCGDYIQWLRANGSDYYRNHYDPTGYTPLDVPVGWNETASTPYLYITKPSAATLIGGSSGDVKILVPGTESVSSENATQTPLVRRLTCFYPFRSTTGQETPDDKPSALTSITVSAVAGTTDAVGLKVYLGDSTSADDIIVNTSLSATGGTYTLSNPIYTRREVGITVEVYPNGQSHQKKFTYNSKSGATVRYYAASDSSTEVVLEGYSIVMSLGILYYDNASGTSVDSTTWKVTSVASGATVDSTLASPVYDGSVKVPRGWIEYLDPLSGVSASEIVRNICGAADCSVAIGSMNRKVQMFRCGGSYYHDYLLALADMTEDDSTGRRHSFCASTSSWASLMFGLRRKATDASSKTLYYGGDTAPSASAIPMMSFNPRKTMQYRPCKAVSKGLDNNGNPIIVCVKDPSIKLGSSAVTVESTDTSSAQAGLNAYNSIMTNRSTDWEGEIVLDGVHPEYMTRSGVYIGGNVVTIYDSRYSMNGLKARVREATFDYQNLKTTLELSNYTEVYSNSINDTSKMAYTSGTLSLAASGEDLYLRQYAFLDVSDQLTINPSSSHTLKIHISDSSTSESEMSVTAECIAYPELGICTLVGYFAPGTAYSTSTYAVDKVTVDSTEISINSYRRPDKRDEQYVIVNVQCSI